MTFVGRFAGGSGFAAEALGMFACTSSSIHRGRSTSAMATDFQSSVESENVDEMNAASRSCKE